MEPFKKSIRRNVAGRGMTDQFYVDGDVNVPDSKSDIGRVVYSRGELKIEDIKMVENYIRVSGKVLYQILYVTDDGGQRLSAIQGKLPFEEMVYAEEEPEGGVFFREGSVDLSVSLIHSRKLSLKAMVEMQLAAEREKEEILTLDVEEEPGLYKRWETKEILKLHAVKKDTYRIKEELTLPRTKETIGTLLFTEVSQRRLDTRLGSDEILLRGEILVFLFYESVDGKIDWVEQAVPYEGRIECRGAEDTMYHHLTGRIADDHIDIRMDEDGEMRILGIEATLEVRAAVYSEEKIDVLKDLYSLRKQCRPEVEELWLDRLVMQNHSKFNLTDQLSAPELRNKILQICHVSGRVQIIHSEAAASGVLVEGVVHISFLYVNADDQTPFDVWQGMVPFTHTVECDKICPGMEYDISGILEQLNIGPLGNGELEVKAGLVFQVFLRQPEKIENIREIKTEDYDMQEIQKGPGVIGYVVKESDELWDLAKKYRTTTEGIREVNQMESDSLKPGDKILIFRENMSIL